MEISYWQSRWEKDNTGWHMDIVYPVLPKIWPKITLEKQSTILVPLCGKSLDLQWFVEQGHFVIGVDASPKAHRTIMDRSSESFKKGSSHGFTIYKSEKLELWEGNLMKLPESKIPPVHLIYDKAAIIALPPKMRLPYAKKLIGLCNPHTYMVLQTFEYLQEEMNGPPFSVDERELEKLFGNHFSLDLLHEQSKLNELDRFRQRGLSSYLHEKVHLLKPLEGNKVY